MKRTQLFGFLLGGLVAVVLLAPAPSSAQCGADASLSPIGLEVKPDAKGPSLSGVLVVEFLNSDGFTATGARAVARLTRGGQLETFYAQAPEYGCSSDQLVACSRTDYVCNWDTSVTCQPSKHVCNWDPLVACDPFADPDPCYDVLDHPTGECVENLPDPPCVDTQHPTGECVEYIPCNPEGTCEANSFDFETPQETQAILIDMLRGPVLGTFFDDVCGNDGSLCPDPVDCGDDGSLCPEECGTDGSLCTPVGVVLKTLGEFGQTDDFPPPWNGDSQIMVTDVVMATTEPL